MPSPVAIGEKIHWGLDAFIYGLCLRDRISIVIAVIVTAAYGYAKKK
jgi:hypothetical protein